MFINEAVCEGCGDCGKQSNCVAIVPVETDLGRKRAIDQSACNKDFSCLEGFCPSFVTVEGGALQEAAAIGGARRPRHHRACRTAATREAVAPTAMLVNGIGGTGVVTIMAVLAEAAHRDGLGFSGIEMTGMAQKGGSVLCHLRFAADQASISAIRVGVGGADVVIGCDLVVTGARATLETMAAGKTVVVVNTHETLTGDFTRNPELRLPGRRLLKAIEDRVGADKVTRLDANEIARPGVRRQHRRQHADARHRLSTGAGAGVGRLDRPGDRPQWPGGDDQPAGVPAGATVHCRSRRVRADRRHRRGGKGRPTGRYAFGTDRAAGCTVDRLPGRRAGAALSRPHRGHRRPPSR